MYKLEDDSELTEEIRNAFKRGLTRAYIKVGDTIINQDNFLMNAQYKDEKADPQTGEFIGVTSMRELTIKLNNLENSLDLENKDIEYHLGAKVGNEYKYINFGNFIVQKPNNEEVNEETTFTALDYMCKFDTDEAYESEIVFPTTLAGLAEDVCRQAGVELGNDDFRNANMPILANPFLNGENPRTVLKSIAKLSFSCAYIGQDNKLYFGFDWYEDDIFTISDTKQAEIETNIERPIDITFKGDTEQIILSSEYQQVEYIESTGTAYIDTGVLPNTNTKIDIDFNLIVAGSYNLICGGEDRWDTNAFHIYTSGTGVNRRFDFGFGSQYTGTANPCNDNTMYNFILDKTGYKINNTTGTFETSTITTNNTIYLFAVNRGATIVKENNARKRIYYCKIYDNDVLVRNMIPCYRISDNEIGMYDTVNNVLYTNIGTGTFVKGNNTPNPNYPIPIKSVTGNNNIVVRNSDNTQSQTLPLNLYEILETPTFVASKVYRIADGNITTVFSGYGAVEDLIQVKPNTTYNFKFSSDLTKVKISSVLFYNSSKAYLSKSINYEINATNSITFMTPSDCGYIAINVVNPAGYQSLIDISNMTNISLTSLIKLNKIGNYQDDIYNNNDKWYKHEEIKSISLGNITSISTATIFGVSVNFVVYGLEDYITTTQQLNYNFLCNKVSQANGVANKYSGYINGKAFVVIVEDNDTVTTVNEKLNGATLKFIPTDTTDIEITEPHIIAQLNAIKELHPYANETTIITVESENGIQPYLDISYEKRKYPTDDDRIAEEITIDGYFENKPNNQVAPITAITLRSSEIKAAGQTVQDDDLIDKYGFNELIIEEDYIAYTDTLRNAYLEAAKALFGLTYKPLDIDLLGSVYLSFNDGIKVINPQGETYRTFALNNIHEYNGTLYNSISVPALTETEEKYKYETEDKTFRRKTAVEIDKANQQIQSIVSEIGDRSEKQTTITQDLDSIELKVSNIADLTVEVNGNNPITLENCLEGNLLQFKIKGNNTVFGGLEPDTNLTPSNELVPYGDSFLKVYTNNKCPTKNEEWTPSLKNLNADMQIATYWYLTAGHESTSISTNVYYDMVKDLAPYRVGYIECQAGHNYTININSSYSYANQFICEIFDTSVLEKMETQTTIVPIKAYGNVSYINDSFVYDTSVKMYNFTVENDGYIFIGFQSLENINIYDNSSNDIDSITSNLIEVDKNYSMYFSIKGDTSYVITNIYYYDENKTYISSYYNYYSQNIQNGLLDTEIIIPDTAKYISLKIRKTDGEGNFVSIAGFNIENIKPMLEYVSKYKGNETYDNTYSGQLPNWLIELDSVYNYGYYHIPSSYNIKLTDTTEFEVEYIEYENTNESSVILGSGDDGIVFYTKTNGSTSEHPYNDKLFVYNGTEYQINTIHDFLNVKTKVSFKYDSTLGNYVLKLEDENNNVEQFNIATTTTFESTENIHIFSNGATDTRCNIALCYLKVWNNNVLVLSLLPGLRKNNGYIGLYNEITALIVSWNSYTSGLGSGGIKYFIAPENDFQNYNEQIIDLGITEVLRQYSSTVYDEFIYDYEDEELKAKVVRRVGVTAGGTLYELPQEIIEPIDIDDIFLVTGINYIDLGKPYIANCYAKYVQINEFTKQFATTYEVESMITQLANSITLLVREKVNKEEVIAELNLEIAEGRGVVSITGNQVIIDSDYFHLTADGQITATAGHIAGFDMWTDIEQGLGIRSWLTRDFEQEGQTYRSGLVTKNDYYSDLLFAGMPLDGGGWSTGDSAFRLIQNGTVYCKRINMNGESGYTRINFDSGRLAMLLSSTGITFRLDDNANTLFGRLTREFNDFTIAILGALGFRVYDELHDRNMYNISPMYYDAKPQHWFTGRMVCDKDVTGSWVEVALKSDLSDERVKENIKDCEKSGLEIIDDIQFKQFDWDKTTPNAGKHVNIGVIAQDLEKIDDNYIEEVTRIINDKEEKLLSVNTLNLLTTTAKAVQELSQKVKELEDEIRKLKGEN